jgi:Uma2 family endonuclease
MDDRKKRLTPSSIVHRQWSIVNFALSPQTKLAIFKKDSFKQEVMTLADVQIIEKSRLPDTPMSLEQFLEWQEEDTRAEWVNGEVIFMSPASRKHQEISKFLTHLMDLFIETRHLGVLLYAPFAMRLGSRPSVREPDLLFVLTKNLSRLKETYLDGPADIVVEIISPESIGRDRGDKFAEYEHAGIPEYWLIDPIRQHAEFYCLQNDHYYPADTPNAIFHSTILTDFWLNTQWLWQEPLPNPLHILRELKIL